jgi:hypothetical protein
MLSAQKITTAKANYLRRRLCLERELLWRLLELWELPDDDEPLLDELLARRDL